MCLHYLLVVLVVLLGNFHNAVAENESFSAQNKTLLSTLTFEPAQIKPSSGNDVNPVHTEEYQSRSHDDKATTDSTKVTYLHDPSNILDSINKSETSHSHSITSEDFAQVTSLVNTTLKENYVSEPTTLPKIDVNEGEDNLSFLIIPVQDILVDEYKGLQDLQVINVTEGVYLVNDSTHDTQMNTLIVNEISNNTEDSIPDEISNESVLNTAAPMTYTGDVSDKNVNMSSEPYQNLNLTELERKLKDEIKMYSNEAVIAWEDLKEEISSDNEISHVLNDYLDKITISQAVNRSECVEAHVEKHNTRVQFLKDVMQSCEMNLKREKWLELQNRTKEILNTINEMVRETYLAYEDTKTYTAESIESSERMETEGKRKLASLDIEKEKSILSDLKKAALNSDEDDYRDCITSNTGHEIIADTLNDIMKIKNNCVG